MQLLIRCCTIMLPDYKFRQFTGREHRQVSFSALDMHPPLNLLELNSAMLSAVKVHSPRRVLICSSDLIFHTVPFITQSKVAELPKRPRPAPPPHTRSLAPTPMQSSHRHPTSTVQSGTSTVGLHCLARPQSPCCSRSSCGCWWEGSSLGRKNRNSFAREKVFRFSRPGASWGVPQDGGLGVDPRATPRYMHRRPPRGCALQSSYCNSCKKGAWRIERLQSRPDVLLALF